MFEKEQGGGRQGDDRHQGPPRDPASAGARDHPPNERGQAKRNEHGDTEHEHYAVAAGIAVSLEEGELRHEGKGQRPPGVRSIDAETGSQGQQPENDGGQSPEPDHGTTPPGHHTQDGQRQGRIAQKDVLPHAVVDAGARHQTAEQGMQFAGKQVADQIR